MALLSYQRIEVNSNLTHFILYANQEFGCYCSSIDSSSLAFILDGADLPVGFDELLFHKLDSTTLLRSAFLLLIHIHILLNVIRCGLPKSCQIVSDERTVIELLMRIKQTSIAEESIWHNSKLSTQYE